MSFLKRVYQSISPDNQTASMYYWGLILLTVSISFSKFTTSIAQILLCLHWLCAGNLKEKFEILRKRKSILIFSSIYLLHLLGLLYTMDFEYALNDMKIKLPLLVLPIIIGTSKPLAYRELKNLLLFLAASMVVNSLICTEVYVKMVDTPAFDLRNISIFISHIRLALLINLAIFSLVFIAFFKKKSTTKGEQIVCSVVIAWLISFLFILKSLTGLTVFGAVALLIIASLILKLRSILLKILFFTLLIGLIGGVFFYVVGQVQEFYNVEKVDKQSIVKYTPKGNPYCHDFNDVSLENGHYVGLYLCDSELRQAWNKRSSIDYDGFDSRHQHVRSTLIRYLTSKGLPKDEFGVNQLKEKDIVAIENSIANYIFLRPHSFHTIIYQIIWQIDVYKKFGNPTGHSITQRIEYIKNGIKIIEHNFWIGVGTGDLQMEYNKQYEDAKSPLSPSNRLRAHNQFITLFIAFGMIGFVWAMLSFFLPMYLDRQYINYFFMVFVLIAFLSMLNEDTFETQAGVTFFAFFYSLFLFGTTLKKEN